MAIDFSHRWRVTIIVAEPYNKETRITHSFDSEEAARAYEKRAWRSSLQVLRSSTYEVDEETL